MRIPKISDNKVRAILQCLIPFAVTFAIGSAALIVFSRSPSGRTATARSVRSGEPVASESRENSAADSIDASELNTSDHSDGRAPVVANRNNSESGQQQAGQSTTQPIAAEGNTRGDTSTPWASEGQIHSYPTTMYQTNLSAGTTSLATSSLSSGVSVPQSSAPTSFAPTATDPNDDGSEYPPRRIPWHQGLTVEQQWYQSWYGWGALEAQQMATFYQSH